MAKSYFIVPLVLLGIFWFIYTDSSEKIHAKEVAEQQAEEDRLAQEELQKKEAERKSKEDAARRTAEREAEEARKLADKRAKWEKAGTEIADATAKAKAESDELQQKINALELKLADLRKQREALNKETFVKMKDVETARIAKRNAELEVQRMAQMVTDRAENSVLVKAPILPPTGKKR
jgi:hypothetical protein